MKILFETLRGERGYIDTESRLLPSALAPVVGERYMTFLERVYDDAMERGFSDQEANDRMRTYDRMNARRFW